MRLEKKGVGMEDQSASRTFLRCRQLDQFAKVSEHSRLIEKQACVRMNHESGMLDGIGNRSPMREMNQLLALSYTRRS